MRSVPFKLPVTSLAVAKIQSRQCDGVVFHPCTFAIRVVVYVVDQHAPVMKALIAAGLRPPQISVLEEGHDGRAGGTVNGSIALCGVAARAGVG